MQAHLSKARPKEKAINIHKNQELVRLARIKSDYFLKPEQNMFDAAERVRCGKLDWPLNLRCHLFNRMSLGVGFT
jgi:hypothetical protein